MRSKIFYAALTVCMAIMMMFTFSSCGNKKGNSSASTHITASKLEVNKFLEEFDAADSRNDKLNTLKEFCRIVESSDVSGKLTDDEQKQVDSALKHMRQYFIDDYDSKLKTNTLEASDSPDLYELLSSNKVDVEALKKFSEELQSLRSLIHNEKGVVCTDEQYDEYAGQIDRLLEVYDEYIKKNDVTTTTQTATTTSASETTQTTTTDKHETSTDKNTNSNENTGTEKPQTTLVQPPVTTKVPATQAPAPNTTKTPTPPPVTQAPTQAPAPSNSYPTSYSYLTGKKNNVGASRTYTFDNGLTVSIPDCVGSYYLLDFYLDEFGNWSCSDSYTSCTWDSSGRYWFRDDPDLGVAYG